MKVNTETRSGGGSNSFVTGSLGALGECGYLTRSLRPLSQTGLGAPGAPSLLGHSAATLGEASSPCWYVFTAGGAFGESLLAALAPRFHSSESNLELTAILCSESKAFYLPFHSRMPFHPL